MKLINVDRERFFKFINNHNLKRIEGSWFHSYNYVNDKNEIMAYEESSSWNSNVIYQIMGTENEETMNFIIKMFNK